MTTPDSEREQVDPFDPDSEQARQAAQDRLIMDYPVELEWQTEPDSDDVTAT